MNRPLLNQLNGKRASLEATYAQTSTTEGYHGPVNIVLFTDIATPEGVILLDKCWCYLTQGLRALCLQPGQRFGFIARVLLVRPWRRASARGPHVNVLQRQRVRLYRPTKLRKLSNPASPADQRKDNTMDMTTPLRHEVVDGISQQCMACIPALQADLSRAAAGAPLQVTGWQREIALELADRVAISRQEIEQLPGFQALRQFSEARGIALELREVVSQDELPLAAWVGVAWPLREPFPAPLPQFALYLYWGEVPQGLAADHYCREFYVENGEQTDGFLLVPADERVLELAQHGLALVLALPTLTPAQRVALQEAQQCLPCLAQRLPTIAVDVEVSLGKPGMEWNQHWGLWLTEDDLELTAGELLHGDWYSTVHLRIRPCPCTLRINTTGPAGRLSQEQKGIGERALMASLRPSPPW
jgi:hypothetical protein